VVLVAVAALVVTACSATAAPAAPAPAQPPYAGALQPKLDRIAEDMLVTGAVVLLRSPELGDWSYTIGTRSRGGNDPVQVGDHVRVGSNTKTYSQDFDLNNHMDIYATKAWKPDELLAKGFPTAPVAQPGTTFYYSNTNTVLPGLIIDQLTGRPIAEEFRTRLFDPVGLADTELPDVSSNAIPEPFARGYGLALV
jgi:D-alanyl-D-alanine carboxypeptidase